MFLEERQKAILDYLDNHEKATVQYFSTIFRVSKETIQKDLSSLSKQNLIDRCHGGAIILRQKFVSNVTSKENIMMPREIIFTQFM